MKNLEPPPDVEEDCNSPELCRARIEEAGVAYLSDDLLRRDFVAIVENGGRVPYPDSVQYVFTDSIK